MELREMTRDDDVNAISRIYALSWKAAYQGIVPQQYLDDLPETFWSEPLSSGQWRSFVLLVDGVYIGTAAIGPARDEAMQGWGELVSLYLLPDEFGQGYGKALLHTAMSALARLGYQKCYLWVLERNARARRFYERNGFAPTSDRLSIRIGGEALVEVRYVSHI